MSNVNHFSKGVQSLIEGKGCGNKKINRVNMSLSNHYDTNLRRLATACGMYHTTLAGIIIEKSLDSPAMVQELQNEYCIQKAYKVVLVKKDGKIYYTLTGREDL
jgi:hypothetical protein